LLLLDEPFAALDDAGIALLDAELAGLARERTMVVATHEPARLAPLGATRLVLA
jgi:ABC-type nitrate/sulfonate/bicarbonate transport system ATPase subunit